MGNYILVGIMVVVVIVAAVFSWWLESGETNNDTVCELRIVSCWIHTSC